MLAQEMLYLLNRKSERGKLVLKVDMVKAYDRVNWRFLIWVMKSFRFLTKVCKLNLIMHGNTVVLNHDEWYV